MVRVFAKEIVIRSTSLRSGVGHVAPDADFESLAQDAAAAVDADTFDEEGIGADMETVGRVFESDEPTVVAEGTEGVGALS
jgi:hypothetical protein